jgi:hypothetical protein
VFVAQQAAGVPHLGERWCSRFHAHQQGAWLACPARRWLSAGYGLFNLPPWLVCSSPGIDALMDMARIGSERVGNRS